MRVHSHSTPIARRKMKQRPVGGEDTMDMAKVRGQNARIIMEDSLMDSIQLGEDRRLGVLIHQTGD